ncbi:MAG: hypothetical protein NVS4B3_27190 [Gemmatimonadaceae bacterium]
MRSDLERSGGVLVSEVELRPGLIEEIGARLQRVRDGFSDEDFAVLVRDVARIQVKYEQRSSELHAVQWQAWAPVRGA